MGRLTQEYTLCDSFDCGHVKLGCRVGLGETSNCLLLVLSKQKARFDYELCSFTAKHIAHLLPLGGGIRRVLA